MNRFNRWFIAPAELKLRWSKNTAFILLRVRDRADLGAGVLQNEHMFLTSRFSAFLLALALLTGCSSSSLEGAGKGALVAPLPAQSAA